jgi:hypothetical protein
MAHGKHMSGFGPCLVECDVPQMARNHYFTGKLMVERDFTDEQRYFQGKDRRHNQHLHGWGTVCGLKVKQHPNEACRDRYLVVEPGTAVDCCGREIVVGGEEVFDFRSRFLERWREEQEAAGEELDDDATPAEPHDFQLCLRYRECPTEEVPSLFDECGCDDTACRPNRILESWELDVTVDPEIEEPTAGGELVWKGKIPLPGDDEEVRAVAVNEPTKRIYAVSQPNPPWFHGAPSPTPTLHAIHLDSHEVESSRSFPGWIFEDLAVSPDGDRIYLSLTEGDLAEIRVLDARDLEGDPVHVLDVDDSYCSLAAAPNGSLLGVLPNAERVLVWDTSINQEGSVNSPATFEVPDPYGITVSPAGYAYVTCNDRIAVIDTADLSATAVLFEDHPFPLEDGRLGPIFAASTEDGDRLAVMYLSSDVTIDVGLLAWQPGSSPEMLWLGNTPGGYLEVGAISPDGRWIYVDKGSYYGTFTEPDEGLVAIEADRIAEGLEAATAEPLYLGDMGEIATSRRGTRLYVAISGEGPGSAGVGVVDAFEGRCGELLEGAAEGCPDCSEGGECVVLATVEGYQVGDRLVDPDPEAAAPADGEAVIDGQLGRRSLPSTTLLAETVRCLLERISAAAERPVRQLTHICATSWSHGGEVDADELRENGLLIAFDDALYASTLETDVFRVLTRVTDPETGLYRWLELPGKAEEVALELERDDSDPFRPPQYTIVGEAAGSAPPNGIRFLPDDGFDLDLAGRPFRVRLLGSFLRDRRGRPVDVDPSPEGWGPEEYPTGDGVPGGTFESWFRVAS